MRNTFVILLLIIAIYIIIAPEIALSEGKCEYLIVNNVKDLLKAYEKDKKKYNLKLQIQMEEIIEREDLVPWWWRTEWWFGDDYLVVDYIKKEMAEMLFKASQAGFIKLELFETDAVTKAKAVFVISNETEPIITEIKIFDFEGKNGEWKKATVQVLKPT